MRIELSSPTRIKITWPPYDGATETEIRRRLAAVPGVEAGHGRMAWCPVIQLARLMELYPKASFEYAAIAKADTLGRRFYDMLVSFHVDLRIDASGAVCAVCGENVSPLIEQLVSERSHALRPFAEAAVVQPVLIEVPQLVAEVHYPRRKSRAKKEKAK